MKKPRICYTIHHQACNDSAIIIGGQDSGNERGLNRDQIVECEIFDIKDQSWKHFGNLATKRMWAGSLQIGKYVYVFGGSNNKKEEICSVERHFLEWQPEDWVDEDRIIYSEYEKRQKNKEIYGELGADFEMIKLRGQSLLVG